MTSKQLESIAKRHGYISIIRDKTKKIIKLTWVKNEKMITHVATKEKSKKQLKKGGK